MTSSSNNVLLKEQDSVLPTNTEFRSMATSDEVAEVQPATNASNNPDAPYLRDSTVGNRSSTAGLRVLYVDDREQQTIDSEDKKSYKGRIRTWPGIMLLLTITVVGISTMTWAAIQSYNKRTKLASEVSLYKLNKRRITGGSDDSVEDIISDDGQVGNPKTYPSLGCQLPNYLSKNGKIYAQSKSKTEIPLSIKGVNWFGMETGQAVPFGLWDNEENGTTAYEVATFLARNKINSVRLPICVENLLNNVPPASSLVNRETNRALNLKNYISLLRSIIKVLGFRHISVLISIHTLTPMNTPPDGLWYNNDLSEDEFLGAIDILTENLCDDEYWNVMGLDLKNEPFQATWGTNQPNDFRRGAERIGNRMLSKCPQWMGFVEGIFNVGDWWGASLQGVKNNPVNFNIAEKVVYAPHFYTPAVYPHTYFYAPGVGSSAGGVLQGYKEVSDAQLKKQVVQKIEEMYGFLATTKGPALVMGEIGGLYATDRHPQKTTQRAVDFTMELSTTTGYNGAYIWSLNPESGYQFNPADTAGNFVEGLLLDDWLNVNSVFMNGIRKLDNQKDLEMFPCFPKKKD